jgi:hypothetical protein
MPALGHLRSVLVILVITLTSFSAFDPLYSILLIVQLWVKEMALGERLPGRVCYRECSSLRLVSRD